MISTGFRLRWYGTRLNGAYLRICTTLLIRVSAVFTFYIKIKALSINIRLEFASRGSLLLFAFTLFRINGMFSLCPLNNNKTLPHSRSKNPRATTHYKPVNVASWQKKNRKQVKIMIRVHGTDLMRCLPSEQRKKKPYIQSASVGAMFTFMAIVRCTSFQIWKFVWTHQALIHSSLARACLWSVPSPGAFLQSPLLHAHMVRQLKEINHSLLGIGKYM